MHLGDYDSGGCDVFRKKEGLRFNLKNGKTKGLENNNNNNNNKIVDKFLGSTNMDIFHRVHK